MQGLLDQAERDRVALLTYEEQKRAANARIAEVSEECDAYQMQRDAANARADAAELAVETWVATERSAFEGIETERDQLAQKLEAAERDSEQERAWHQDTLDRATKAEAERDQLAAREKARADAAERSLATAQKSNRALLSRELANRAAKAKRGGV